MQESDIRRLPRPRPQERRQDRSASSAEREPPSAAPQRRRSAAELLNTPNAMLTRSHLRELGLERRAIDAIFRALPVVALPGYSRPMVRAADFTALVENNTYYDDRVRPT